MARKVAGKSRQMKARTRKLAPPSSCGLCNQCVFKAMHFGRSGRNSDLPPHLLSTSFQQFFDEVGMVDAGEQHRLKAMIRMLEHIYPGDFSAQCDWLLRAIALVERRSS